MASVLGLVGLMRLLGLTGSDVGASIMRIGFLGLLCSIPFYREP